MPDSSANRREGPDALAESRKLMDDFARSTGLVSARPPRRYLWTDAFAVCNYLGLHEITGEDEYLELALRLVDQVHHTLGRHRDDDPREGWISGLPESEGEKHPTVGGLRIGKPLPERKPGEPYDRRMEWERDGQYFHYLTRWMDSLNAVWGVTEDVRYHRWAVELAEAAVHGFARSDGTERRLHWKMSINLSRPLVPSTGQHDPLDGYLTASALRATAPPGSTDALAPELHMLRAMVERGRGSWATSDSLGAGGLLVDAYRSVQLRSRDDAEIARRLPELPEELLDEALRSVAAAAGSGFRTRSAEGRLAFRELGLSIGLGGVERMESLVGAEDEAGSQGHGEPRDGEHSEEDGLSPGDVAHTFRERVTALKRYLPLRDEIHRFWLDPDHRRAQTWTEHRDISQVMLATSLVPGGYLEAC